MLQSATDFADTTRRRVPRLRGWYALVILALAPLWLLGMFDRGLWTPDEPREADIAWRMSEQSERAIPHLGVTPFLEKPPLTYWLSAASAAAFGDSPATMRVPNLLYALIVAAAMSVLAAMMAGGRAACVAALVAGSALLSYRVAIWLAPDAALLAGSAVALAGAYAGYTSPAGARKFWGYALMHAGAAFGFMAKSAPGWLVPALALGTLIVWERRWSELRRWELYAGAALQARWPGVRIDAFGHVGDGNIHVNVTGLAPDDDRVDEGVLGMVGAFGGSISAEHGIGVAKKRWLGLSRSHAEVAAFRSIKRALDPDGVLNPNVLLSPEST